MTIGAKIELLRKRLGLTQTELGEKLGVKKNAVSKWETGRVYDIPTSKIRAMAELFGVMPSYLLDEEEDVNPLNARPMPSTRRVPRLGVIACGEPILAEQNIEGYDEAPDFVKCDFTLVCRGDSMTGARIMDGDIVYIKQQNSAPNGAIEAVIIDNDFESEATLKRIRFIKNGVMLLPENSDYEPMVFVGEDLARVRIIGIATHFVSTVK